MKNALWSALILVACSPDPITGEVALRSNPPMSPAAHTRLEIAKQAISDVAVELIAERQSLTGYHHTYVQTFQGLPVYGSYLQVHLNKDLSVDNVVRAVKDVTPSLVQFGPTLSDDDAIAAAVASLSNPELGKTPVAEKVVFPGESTRLAWKVALRQVNPFADWEVVVAADNGEILVQRDRALHAEGKAKLFNPNPVESSQKFDLVDGNNADTDFLTAQRVEVALLDLDESGTLTGKYATTLVPSNTQRALNKDFIFDFTRSQTAFEETMAYFHITTMQHYLQDLGFTNINNRQITLSVNTIPDDNSFYSPSDKEITFGTGGVDDAEDATIIYHEAGHSMQDNQVPGWGETLEGRSMGEGFGDYWAASAFNKTVANVFIGTWDATSYNPGTPGFLRRLDTPKHYPQDLHGEVHDDGEIWSACLWQLWGFAGKERADKLILESHFLLTPDAKFVDGANAILKANEKLFASADADTIKKIFVDRGILKN